MAPRFDLPSRRTGLRVALGLVLACVAIGIATFVFQGHAGHDVRSAAPETQGQSSGVAEAARGKDASATDAAGKDGAAHPSASEATGSADAQLATASLDGVPQVQPIDEGSDDSDWSASAAAGTAAIPDNARYEPSVALISVREGASTAAINELIAQSPSVAPREVSEEEVADGVVKLELTDGASLEDALNELSASEEVESAQPNYIYYAMLGDERDLRDCLVGSIAKRATGALTIVSGDRSESDEGNPVDPAAGEVPATEEASRLEETDDGSRDEATAGLSEDADGVAVLDGELATDDEEAAGRASGFDIADEPASQVGSQSTGVGPEGASSAKESGDLLSALADPATNDPELGKQWALAAMRVFEAWTLAKCEHNVGVAVFDQGPDVSHVDLKPNIVDSYDCAEKKKQIGFTDMHGTMVSGIVCAAAGNGIGCAGVSYNANLVAYNIAYEQDGIIVSSTDTIIRAYQRLESIREKYNIRVVNLSMGAPGRTRDDALVREIREARAHGIVTVTAAGNRTNESETFPYYVYPGDCDAAVSVININKDLKRSDSSNYNLYGQIDKNISAPGTSILSTVKTGKDEYQYGSGTSYAAPQVSGVLALMFAANPNLTADEAVETLYATAKELGGRDFASNYYGYGWGLVDAYEAVRAAQPGGEHRELPSLDGLVVEDPTFTCANRIPVGGQAPYVVERGKVSVQSGGSIVKVEGDRIIGLKAGTAVLVVKDPMGTVRLTHTVTVYDSTGTWQLASTSNQGYVLDIQGGSISNGGNAIVYANKLSTNQVWLLERQGSGGFLIRSARTGKVLDVSYGSTASGANVLQYASGNKAWQRWRLVVQPDNNVVIENENSKKCLEINASSARNSVNVRQATQTGAARQKWVLKKVKADIGAVWDGEYRISSRLNTSFALDVAYGSKANGGNIIIYKWKGGKNQRWRIQYLGNKLYRIVNVNSGRVLDVAYASQASGANIVQWGWGNKANQRWNIQKNSDGSYGFVRQGSSRVVAVAGSSAANARNVHQYAKGSATNQRWTLQQF